MPGAEVVPGECRVQAPQPVPDMPPECAPSFGREAGI